MLRSPAAATVLSSLYLLAYLVFFYGGYANVVFMMFLAAPAVLIWLAYTIIRYGKFEGPELEEGEEWGYSDRPKKR